MIIANVVFRENGEDTNWGAHEFASDPHAGDHIMLYVDGAPWSVVIETLYHAPRAQAGLAPGGDPSLTLLVRRSQ